MATEIITAIPEAMVNLDELRQAYSEYGDKIFLRLLMHKLEGLRTFLLCLKKLGTTKVTSFTYPNVEDCQVSHLLEIETDPETEGDSDRGSSVGEGMESDGQLESLLQRLECFVERIVDQNDYIDVLFDIETMEEEIDQWYTSLSDYLPVASNPPAANEVEDIFNSVLKNLEHFLSLHIAYVGVVAAPVEALKGNISFWRNFLRFAAFLGIDHQQQEFRDMLANLEAIAFSAAHFTTHIFSVQHYNIKVFSEAETNLRAKHYHGSVVSSAGPDRHFLRIDALNGPNSYKASHDRIKSSVSELLVRINPLDNPHLHESYSRALVSMKWSRNQSCVTNLDIQESTALLRSILWELLQFDTGLTLGLKNKMQELYGGLTYLRALLKEHPGKFDGSGIFDVGVMIFSVYQNQDSIIHGVDEFLEMVKVVQAESKITKDMEKIKVDSEKIFDDKREELQVPQEVNSTRTDYVTSQSIISSADEFVGFEDERKSVIDRLTRGSKKMQVVAIVGMPGLGKTTLATRVYNEASVQQHFHVRAWCSISQVFNKRKVLRELVSHILGSKSSGDYSKMTEDELAQELRRSLLRRRYLIFIDDVWEIKAFESLKPSFPDDSSGRILLTSRIRNVAKLDAQPHVLRQLTFSESLELLQKKVSPNKGLSQSLYDIAVKISVNCKGLPLIIIIVAGLLLAATKQEVWDEVLESLTSGIISSTEQCEKTIELSYKHLPEHLKPCLLSFGAFPEDEEISVRRLIWSWIAEGFVQKPDSRSLEEVAEDHLNDLIGRSLVMDGRKRSEGGIKTCRVHDAILDFCLRKAEDENVLQLLNGKDKVLPYEDSRNLRGLCVHSKMEDFMDSKLFFPRLRSLSFIGPKRCKEVTEISFIFRVFKLLRVLKMEHVYFSSYDFPGEVGLLVQLRYLEISVTSDISPSIGNLFNLETLILKPVYETLITMPVTFWNLQKLRHLYLNLDDFRGIVLPVDNSCEFLELDSLSGLCSEHWGIMESQLRNFPNLGRLRCWVHKFGDDIVDGSKVMSFSFLSRLESLTLSCEEKSSEFEFIFPDSLKKLNLCGGWLSWEKISRAAQLPNLEVLKLLDHCFIGEKWQMEEGDFSKLRFLKLEYLDVVNWTGWDDQFPNLEKLVVEECSNLEEIPECLESVDTLEMIEVIKCPDRVERLFQGLADYLKDRGNSVLQFHVRRPTWQMKASTSTEENEGEDSAIIY